MEFLFECGGAICHQLPYKSFYLGEEQFWLCARCSGMYIGAFVALGWTVANRWRVRFTFDRRWWIYVMTTLAVLVADLVAGNWLVQGWVVPRFITGYFFGVAATAGAFSYLIGKVGTNVQSISIRPWWPTAVGVVLIAWIGIIHGLTPVQWGAPVLSIPVAAGLLTFWGIWNSLLFVLIFPRLPVSRGVRSLLFSMSAGLLMFAVEASVAWFSN